jgi:hypothetical protein
MAEKHHYLAQTYLKGFLAPGQTVLHACRGSGPVFTVVPRNFGARNGYYSVPQDWIQRPPRVIEDLFGKFEHAVTAFLRRALDENAEPTQDEVVALRNLVAVHYARVPARRDSNKTFHAELVGKSAALLNRADGMARPEDAYFVVENTDLGLMLNNLSVALALFSAMNVVIVYFDEPCVITGDNPVGLHYRPDEARIALKRQRFSRPERPYDPAADLVVPKYLHLVSMPLNRRAYLVLMKDTQPGILAMPIDQVVWGLNAALADRSKELAGPGSVLLECARRQEAPLPTEWSGGLVFDQGTRGRD